MKSILKVTYIAVIVSALLTTGISPIGIVDAAPPTRVEGDWTYALISIDGCIDSSTSNRNITKCRFTDEHYFTGDINGTFTFQGEYIKVELANGDARYRVRERGNFTGTVLGMSGTFEAVFKAEVRTGNDAVRGTWNIIPGTGTDDLANIDGKGKWSGSFQLGAGSYTGRVNI